MSTRIYIVSPSSPLVIGKNEQKSRLIRAASPGQAVRHATSGLFSVSVANTEQVAALVGVGTGVEDAKEE